MKQEQTTLAQKFSRLASRVADSIKPAFQALAQKALTVLPHFSREATPARAAFALHPAPVMAVAALQGPKVHALKM